jgi:hypothetical protein
MTGGPVYVTDIYGQQDFEILRKLVASEDDPFA